ncbi:transport protein Avl9-domain-containing protein [Phellopilus nigrolimitatus]|nr:transport protein Avl9-domain-containing protein [Phellopilus nigrolimitatus]
MKYPPMQLNLENDASSMVSYSSTSSRKVRPESRLMESPVGPIVPGIALVDFNHLVGPRIEFSEGSIFEDEQLASILPFLALPDGAHLSSEDYSYFHLVPSSAHPTTVFGISCNRQIKAADLLFKDEDVTRSTVQKAVVVLASKPVFGPIRDRLGVVTRALFSQRDFRETGILVDFKSSLELSLRTQLTESALYMGVRELVHKFRNRTLLLLKSLILQKRIMFYGHPVERLCTYQYSLISLIPGLLQNIDDCGSPPLASRASALASATSLKTSDRKSLMAYLGLPLDIFGKDAFFQPYLPLQQVDLTKRPEATCADAPTTIVTQQKEIDLLVNIETNTFEFRDPKLERLVALTPADRKWMDDIVRDVNEGWDDADPNQSANIQFKGSDDYLRTKRLTGICSLKKYVTAALASVKYADFLAGSERSNKKCADGGDMNAILDFNPSWIAEFKRTNAFEVWDRITDPMLFDIVEARHPCTGKPGVVEDIGLRLQEGLQDLNLQEQLAPTREAISRTIASGSTSFFKAVEGVRERWAHRPASSLSIADETSSSTVSSTPIEITRSEIDLAKANESSSLKSQRFSTASTASQAGKLKPLALATSIPTPPASDPKATLNLWGSSIGSFISQRTTRLATPRRESATIANNVVAHPSQPSHTSPAESLPVGRTSRPGSGVESSIVSPASTPVSSLFSSWTLGKAASTKPTSPAPMTSPEQKADEHEENIEPVFLPRDLGEFEPPSSSNSSINSVQPGMAL